MMKHILGLNLTRTLQILATVAAIAYPALGADNEGHVTVKAGESIQAAIDAAQSGSSITVLPGTYAEQLTISKDNITLLGQGAVIVPPDTPADNLCAGIAGNETAAGICVAGTDVELADFVFDHRKVLSVGQYVKNVHINGFTISGFSGLNIGVVGAENTHVGDNVLRNGDRYGFLAVGSTNTFFSNNVITSTDPARYIAVCNDNPSGVEVSNNYISGYYLGLCIQTSGAVFLHNHIENCCIGAFVDPTIEDVKLLYNNVGAINPLCANEGDGTGSGIVLFGSLRATVQANILQNQTLGGMAAGIAVLDAVDYDPASNASGNVITGNVFLDNDFDIFLNTTQTDNTVSDNRCTTPPELCSA